MSKIVFVNSLTFLRVVLSILFFLLVLYNQHGITYSVIIFGLIFLTDFWDGRLARSFNVTSKAGAIFDVLADIFFVITSFSALISKNVLPAWILGVALFKFVEFWITSAYLTKTNKSCHPVFVFDISGKAAAIALYAMPITAIILSTALPQGPAAAVILTCCSLVTLLSAVSSCYRISLCISKPSLNKTG